MYEIISGGVLIALCETPRYIKRKEKTGAYIEATAEDAEGIAVGGDIYNLPGGSAIEGAPEAAIRPAESGECIFRTQKEVEAVKTETEATVKLSGQMEVAAKLTVQESTTISDEDALQMPDLFKTWSRVLSEGKALKAESILNKDGTLYRVVQEVTPAAHQEPGGEGMLAIYRPIDVTHEGTLEDPIPWVYGMDCSTGLYYTYEGKTYLCEGDMKPCVWAPGSAGMWQWSEVTE